MIVGEPQSSTTELLIQNAVLFDGYAKHPKTLAVVEALIGPDVKSIHSMLINKPPNVDGRHPIHQDHAVPPEYRAAGRAGVAPKARWCLLQPVMPWPVIPATPN